jgi:hypothetical protein
MAKKIPGIKFQSEETRKPGLLAAALWDDGSLGEHLKKYGEEDSAKLLLLCQHYGIQASPIMFYQLALALARELYPEPKKRGRKSKWTVLNKGALVVEVERLVKPDDRAHGVAWACQQLAKQEPWASFLETKEGDTFDPDPAEALRQIYYDFQSDKWAAVWRDAFRFNEHEGAIAEWENLVMDFVRNPHPK